MPFNRRRETATVVKVAAVVTEVTAAVAVAEATPTTDMPAVKAASVLLCAFFYVVIV
jgi:hypothetical protein